MGTACAQDHKPRATPQTAEALTAATLKGLASLPTLAPVAARLLQATSDPNADVDELTSVIQTDQALSTRVLRLVNSAAMGVRHRTASVKQATSLLGFSAIRNCALSVKVFDGFRKARTDGCFDVLGFWKHSLGVACCSQMLADQMGVPDREEVFTAGLLHDIGKIAAAHCLPNRCAQVPKVQVKGRLGTLEAERRVFGLSHSRIGAIVCEHWRLPEVLKHSALLHHIPVKHWPGDASTSGPPRLVQLADRICRDQHLGVSGVYLRESNAETLAAELGLSPKHLTEMRKALREQVEEKAEILDLEGARVQDLFLEGIEQANEELGRINEELVVANLRLAKQRRLLEEDLRLAETVQRTIIPPNLEEGPVQVRVSYEPASKVGGDYAYFDLRDDRCLYLCVGDVTGHGIAASLVTNRIHGEVVRLVREQVHPGELVRGLNHFLCDTLSDTQMLMSFVCIRLALDAGKLWYSNAAHPSPMLSLGGGSEFQCLDSHVTFLGVRSDLFDDTELQSELDFQTGQQLILYTDGVIEAFNPAGKPLGMDGWTALVSRHLDGPDTDRHERLAQSVARHVAGEASDDVTIAVVTTHPETDDPSSAS